MGFFDFFKKKSSEDIPVTVPDAGSQPATHITELIRWLLDHNYTRVRACDMTYIEMYKAIPEVFFPIEFLASRIAGARFVLKREKDDTVVWHNKPVNGMLSKPNCVYSWEEFVHDHFVWKLSTGTSFIRAVTSIDVDFRSVLAYWVLPSDHVDVQQPGGPLPLYGASRVEDLIAKVVLRGSFGTQLEVKPSHVFIDRDGLADLTTTDGYMRSHSRLESQRRAINNLLAVYDARNVIYEKRGGLGYIVSRKMDAAGTDALTEAEKKSLLEQNAGRYGLRGDQFPYGISDVPIDFVRTNLSISDLQPFDETLADAISIAGAYGIPAVLVPRKDQSTFNNQSTAEKAVYTSVVIPMCKKFCRAFGDFIGLGDSGLYLDCDFSDVDCLQIGLKEAETVKKLVNDRCLVQFGNGLITLNDWRAQIGEAEIDESTNPLFSKLKFDMTDEELAQINKIINNTKTPSEDERTNEKPAVQDEGE